MESAKTVREILQAVCNPEQQPHEWAGRPDALLEALQAAVAALGATRKQRVAQQRAGYAAQVRAEMKAHGIRGAELARRMDITPNRIYGAFHDPRRRSKEWWERALVAARLEASDRSSKTLGRPRKQQGKS